MRRLAFAAVLGSLVLAACSDQQQQTPTEPGPSFAKTTQVNAACSNSPWLLFPPASIGPLSNIFPGGNGKTLLSSARDKISAITQSCQSGKLKDAQAKAMFFDEWMFKQYRSNSLLITPVSSPSDRQKVFDLFVAVLEGVLLNASATVTPDLVNSDAGVGVFQPGIETTVFTSLFLAALNVPSDGFNETTLLIIEKLPNNTHLNTNGQAFQQFPPFYDFNALNGSNQHVLQVVAGNQRFAHVEMCLYQLDATDYPPGFAIGHNPVFGAPGYPFEVLQDDGIHLLNACDGSNPESSLRNPGTLEGFALFAWNSAKRTVGSVLLPQPLQAATAVVGSSGSASGKTSSLSPFGIVAATTLGFTEDGNPTDSTFTSGSQLIMDSCNDGCDAFPAVKLMNADGSGIGGVPITVSLIKVGNSPGEFTSGGEGGSTTVETTDVETGVAVFDNLVITEPGTYKLKFTAPSNASVTSGEFTVVEPTD